VTATDGVFAVIVAHGDLERAGRCASSLGLPADRVIVVANVAPSAVSAPWRVMSPAGPQGYGANLNLGVAQAPPGTRWLILLNDDVVFEPLTLEGLLAAGQADPHLGAITPALYGEDRRPQAVAFRHPTVRSELAGTLGGPDILRRALRRGHSVLPSGAGVSYEDWVLGAAVLVRFSAFADVGGVDERYFMYSEDTQFGLDLRRAGWRSGVLHDEWALHIGATSTSEARWDELLAASRRRYLRHNLSRPRFAALCLLWPVAQAWNMAYLAAMWFPSPSARRARLAHLRAQWRWPPWR